MKMDRCVPSFPVFDACGGGDRLLDRGGDEARDKSVFFPLFRQSDYWRIGRR